MSIDVVGCFYDASRELRKLDIVLTWENIHIYTYLESGVSRKSPSPSEFGRESEKQTDGRTLIFEENPLTFF